VASKEFSRKTNQILLYLIIVMEYIEYSALHVIFCTSLNVVSDKLPTGHN
jgi:hypothetical protein